MADYTNKTAESAEVSGTPSILEIRSLQKAFGTNSVLKDISLCVDRGNVISIIGPSGSGKSTLLRCAAFLETADGGDILYEGQYAMKDGVYASKAELIRFRKIFGLVFQNFQLFPHYSVLRNVSEAPILHGENKDEVQERAMTLLRKMGLEGKENAYPYQLSGGQQQRVAIARAISTRPSLFLADEPTGNLDSRTGEEIMDIFRELHEEGNTIVLITHDPSIADKAQRQIRIRDGKVQEL